MDTFAILPLLCNCLTCSNAADTFETERGKVPKHYQLVYAADWVM